MISEIQLTLAFTGRSSDAHEIDFYDVSQALLGFQRSIALTTHLVLNNEIITQAPSLKGAKIYALPPEEGSWKIQAAIVLAASGLYQLGTTQNNSPIGHLVFSLYDYIISESLGTHVDYTKSLNQLYEEAESKKLKLPKIKESQADSLIEKCSAAVREMHRPIYKSGTATTGSVLAEIAGKPIPLSTQFTIQTYEFIHETKTSDKPENIEGWISSYNSNTYKGRIFVPDFGRPVPFELAIKNRTKKAIRIITSSLRANALKQHHDPSLHVYCRAYRNTSRSGNLKTLTILDISNTSFD